MWDRPAFTVGEHQYVWLDVLLAAMWRGEWDRFETRLREGLACEAFSYDTDDPADQDSVDAASNDFRYEHELITAEETEAWLERVGLSLESWSRFFARQALRARWIDRLPAILATHAGGDSDLLQEIAAEGICSGTFRQMATTLAGSAAISMDAHDDDLAALPPPEADRIDAVSARHRQLFPSLPPREYHDRLTHLAALETISGRARARALTPDALQSQVDTSRLDWILVTLQRLPFPEESMVREALLCCREETLTLEQLATRINRRVLTDRMRLEACPGDLRALLLSAQPGELLGPVAHDSSFQAVVVLAKQLPTLEDDDVKHLAETALVSATLRRARVLHVRWHLRF